MSESVQGTCFLMCPEKERKMREREGLLHLLEIDEETKHLKKPKADPKKTVKCFSRPAAGKATLDLTELRPGPVLLLTLRYLLNNVVLRSDVNWALVYEFIFDRLRAVRQDMVIQRINVPMSILLFEPIVRFHIYAGERMCERSLNEYIPKFNEQHLLECLKHLLVLYDEQYLDTNANDFLCHGLEGLTVNDNRSELEALYILKYLGDNSALQRGLSLPLKYRDSKYVQIAIEISMAWHLKNYVRVCRLIKRLPPLLACAALSNLPSIRRNSLLIMSVGYNSQSLLFPGLKLQEILLYNDINKIRKDCELFGLAFVNENIKFQRSKFNDNILLANTEKHFTDLAMHKLLPKILL